MRSTDEVRRSSVAQVEQLVQGGGLTRTRSRRSKLWPIPQIMWFAVVSGLAGAMMNAIFTFFPSVMTTLEKRFNINNQRLSYILLANDISAICIGPFCTYYLAKRNIPKALCLVLLMMMLYSFIIASPHYLYGSGEVAMSFVEANVTEMDSALPNAETSQLAKMCNANVSLLDEGSRASTSDSYFWVLAIFFAGHFICGIADSIFWSLLLTYMDNNVSKAMAPMAHSLSMVIRFFGILLGNAMNNLGLQIYINPFVKPTIDYTDPRWIGAWWFTPTVLGFLFLIPAYLMTRFPAQIRKATPKGLPLIGDNCKVIPEEDQPPPPAPPVESEHEKPSLNDMLVTLKRVMKNKIVIYSILGYIARRFAHLPFNTYMVKYMEQLYNIPTADANGYIAKYDTTSLIAGILLSGFVTTKLRPSARQLQAFSMFVAFLLATSTAGYIFYRCDEPALGGIQGNSLCAVGCDCDDVKFSPICGSNQITYNSPCEAGCESFNTHTKLFANCSCITNGPFSSLNSSSILGFATDGPCRTEMCKYPFYFFLATQATTNFLAACTWTSATIITLRSVEPRDKAFCLSLFELLGSLFVSIPGPLILSRILDKICIRRDVQSNANTHCWEYDRTLLSYTFNGTSSLLLCVCIVFKGMVWKHLKHIQIFDKDDKKKTKTEKEQELIIN